jgi:hypothetical protein
MNRRASVHVATKRPFSARNEALRARKKQQPTKVRNNVMQRKKCNFELVGPRLLKNCVMHACSVSGKQLGKHMQSHIQASTWENIWPREVWPIRAPIRCGHFPHSRAFNQFVSISACADCSCGHLHGTQHSPQIRSSGLCAWTAPFLSMCAHISPLTPQHACASPCHTFGTSSSCEPYCTQPTARFCLELLSRTFRTC